MSWPNLPNPPVVLAVFELRYRTEVGFNIKRFLENEGVIQRKYPERVNKVHGNINLPALTMGISTAQVSSQQTGYVFLSSDKLKKITISTESLVFTLEGAYPGWDEFKSTAIETVNYFQDFLADKEIFRTSIRFINRFTLPDSDDPTEYFNTVITASKGVMEDPIDSYFFRYIRSIPKTEIKVIVNNSLEDIVEGMSNFIFDIDVLCHEHFIFRIDYLSEKLERIRAEKNEIFFKNITKKTLEIIS
jgi:uncharacterized protein (TIGR04255 family)